MIAIDGQCQQKPEIQKPLHFKNLKFPKQLHFGQDRLPLAIPLLVLSKTCLGDFVKTQTHAASINAE